jgi:transcriptional regulator with XRE-family HTH domain
MTKRQKLAGTRSNAGFITSAEFHAKANKAFETPGEIIKQARLKAGLTQFELAVLCGETQSVLSAYERGKRKPSFDAVNRILMATGTYLVPQRSKTSKMQMKQRGEKLEQVLELATAFPSKTKSKQLQMPKL